MIQDTTVDVLGAKIITTDHKRGVWEPAKTEKILREIKLIKALPCAIDIQEHLLSMKVMPQ